MENHKSRLKLLVFCPYIVLMAMTMVFIFRAFLGFDWSDEGYYLALPYQFLLGDHMFVNSWDIHQTSALLTAPILWLFRDITGGMDGVFLFTRILFLLFQLGVSILVYQKTFLYCSRRLPALLAAAVCLSFIPFGISNFSYYTMGYLFMICSSVLLLSLYCKERSNRKKTVEASAAGLFFALSCIAYPAFIVILPVFLLLLMICRPSMTKENTKRKSLHSVCFFLLGALLIAVIAGVYLGATTGVMGMKENVGYIFQGLNFEKVELAQRWSSFIQDLSSNFFLGMLQLFILILLLMYHTINPGINLEKLLHLLVAYFMPLCILGNIVVILIQPEKTLPLTAKIGHLQTCAGLWPVILIAHKPTLKGIILLFSMYVPAFIMSMASYMIEDNGITGAVYPMVISMMSAVLILYDYYEVAFQSIKGYLSKVTQSGALVLIVIVIISTGILRVCAVYRDAPITKLTVPMKSGPAAGLYTTAEGADLYEKMVDDIRSNVAGDGNVLFLELLPFGYLCTEQKPAAESLLRIQPPFEKELQYFELHPEKRPSVVYIVKWPYGIKNNQMEMTEEQIEKLMGKDAVREESKYAVIYR